MNGWLLVRIAGIVVGIATLLRVATNEGIVTYDPLFLAWMDWLSDIVELGFLMDVIQLGLNRVIDWVRSSGWNVPTLYESWRPVFILSTLYFGAYERNNPGWRSWLLIPAGAAVALTGGVIAGLSPGPGMVAGFLVAYSLFYAFRSALYANPFWVILNLSIAIPLAVATLVIGMSWVVVIPLALHLLLAVSFAGSRSGFHAALELASAALISVAFLVPGVSNAALLLSVVAYVTFRSAINIFWGIHRSWGDGLDRVVANPHISMGIDVLGVMLGALFIASLFANPPIW